MQALAKLSVSRPVVAAVLILVLVVVGFFSLSKLGIDRFPNLDIPVCTVTTTLPGATPEEMETQVTEEIEKQVNTVSGIDSLSSSSADGVSIVQVQFVLEKNGDVGAQEVRSKVDLALPNLPREVDKPIVQKFDTSSGAVLAFTLSSDKANIRELTEYADKKLRPQIETINGVGEVDIVGGQARQINVMLNPYSLHAYQLNAIDVRKALLSQNLQVPGGALDEGSRRISVRTRGRVQNVEEMRNIVVKTKDGQPIRLRDVAIIEDSQKEQQTVANVNGTRALLLNVRKQSGVNTVAVIDAVKQRLTELKGVLPPGYSTKVVSDQSTFIKAALDAVQHHLILGSILASMIVLVFLWNWRSALIAAIAIPASLISTFTLMSIMGFTLNVITLLALTLAVGIVIDDAVIVLENIYRFVEEKKMSPRRAAVEATKEIGLAVLATTFSLVAVFVPVAFMTGIIGRFLNSFGLTMAFAIMVSLLVAFTLTPMLSSRWLKRPKEALREVLKGSGLRGPVMPERAAGETSERDGHSNGAHPYDVTGTPSGSKAGFFYRLETGYAVTLRWALGHRWVIALGGIAIFMTMGPIGGAVAKNFLPDDDESQYIVSVRAPEGTSLATTEDLLNRIATDIRKLPEVKFTVVTIGNDSQQTRNLGNVLVQLNQVEVRKSRVSEQDLMVRTRKEIISKYPRDLRTIVSPPNAFGGGAQAGISYVISGPDLDKLTEAGTRIVTDLKSFPAAADSDTSAVVGKPELGVEVDRNAAADLVVSVQDVADTLRIVVAGEKEGTFAENGYQYDVNLRALPEFRSRQDNLDLFLVPADKEGLKSVPVSQVIHYKEGTGPAVINRYARTRQVTISANVTPGASEQTVHDKIQQLFEQEKLGPLYRGTFTGRSKEMAKTFSSFGTAFLLAVIFTYLILAAQFESWVYPVVILMSLPLTMPFALLSVFVLHESLNIFSMLGILVLFGVVMKNAILQVDHTIGLRAKGMARNDAIVQACRDRLRPILMTTIAFVAGMIPLAVSSGTGAGTNRATSSVIIGGQVLSLVLTLVATPVFYSMADDMVNLFNRFMQRFRKSEPSYPDDYADTDQEVAGALPLD